MRIANASELADSGEPPSGDRFAAIQVAIVDLSDEMPVLYRGRTGGGDYGGMWVLVLDNGCPLGVVEFPFTGASIGGAALMNLLLEGTKGAVHSDPSIETPDSQLPFASIVVPTTFDRFDQLQRCAERLSSLDYPDYEVVIVDNRPDRPNGQAERDVISTFPRVRVITEQVRGISAARNRGVAASTGEFVAFTDDDVKPHPAWLRRIGARYAADPEVSSVTGLVVPDEFETVTQLWFEQSGVGLDRNFHRYEYRSIASDTGFLGWHRERFMVRRTENNRQVDHWLYMIGSFGMGCNLSFRRKFLDHYGGFDLALGAGTPSRGGEDIIPMIELLFSGHTLVYEPSAIVSHAHRRTYEDLREQIYGYGVGFTAALTALAWRNPKHLVGYLRVVIPGARAFLGIGPSTRPEKPIDYPTELTRLEMKGLLFGPIAYIQSRWLYRGRRSH
jgi:glycosyltransferase involved in cell wall biosynthesis